MAKSKESLCLSFDGVKVSGDYMTGVMTSDELIEHFDQTWIPGYQRDRVMNKKKIESLKEVFKNGGKIDSIKLNLIGDYIKEGRQALVSGILRAIDGQQRLWALKESGVKGLNIPVELYLNIAEDEEIELFHQFNRDPSKLTLGELAKSARGTFGVSLVKSLEDTSLPIRVNINSRAAGINLPSYGAMLHMIHKKIYFKMLIFRVASGKSLLQFLEQSYPESQAAICQYGLRNILSIMVSTFGSYDGKAMAYSRSFMLPFANFLVSNFMNDNGQIVMERGHKAKLKEMPRLLANSRVREIITGSGSQTMIYNEIIGFMNHKVKNNRLPPIEARAEQEKSKEYVEESKKREIETKRKTGVYAKTLGNLKNQKNASGGKSAK